MNGEECFGRGCRRRRQRASGHTLGSLLIQRAERGRAKMPKQHKGPTGRRRSVKGPEAKSGVKILGFEIEDGMGNIQFSMFG